MPVSTGAWVLAALAMVAPPGAESLRSPWDEPLLVAAVGDVELALTVSPTGPQLPGAELTYSMKYTNSGSDNIVNIVIEDQIPAWTQFKVGSTKVGTPPPSVASITPQYSSDGGASWTYAPVSGGGGAPASFDANVTHVRFLFAGHLKPGIAPPVGISFTVRIRD